MPNDNALYTGMTSNASKEARAERLKAQQAKEVKRNALLPVAELINVEILKIRNEIADELRKAVTLETTEAELKALVLGLKLADERIAVLKTRLDGMLRKPKNREIIEESDA